MNLDPITILHEAAIRLSASSAFSSAFGDLGLIGAGLTLMRAETYLRTGTLNCPGLSTVNK